MLLLLKLFKTALSTSNSTHKLLLLLLSRPRVADLKMVTGVASTAPSQGAICLFSSSSRFVTVAPSRALKRREACTIQSASSTTPNRILLSSCPRFYHSFYHGGASSVERLYYKLMTDSSPAKMIPHSSVERWYFKLMTDSSPAKMIPYYQHQNSFEGKPSKEIFNRQKVDKRGEQVSRNCSSTSIKEVGHNSPYGPPSTLKWDDEVKRLKKTKAESSLYFQEAIGSRQITSQNHKLLDKSDVQELIDAENVTANGFNSKYLVVTKPALTEPDSTGNRNIALDPVNLHRTDSSTKETSDSKGRLSKETKAKPQDLHHKLTSIYNNVLVVDNVSDAKKIVKMLTQQYRHLVHACDTEVAKIDVKQATPVDHGEIICFSIYSGPQADFGNGKSCLWIDVLDGGRDLLIEFAPFFEDPSIKKVWHNYSFDNHVIENYGFKVLGFHADTMHMARLWDSSRRADGGYSLEALTSDKDVMSDVTSCQENDLFGKVSMKTIFGRRKVKKDGSEGKLITIPPVEELQREERRSWICYSALDAISTLKLYETLRKKLLNMNWKLDGKLVPGGTMFDFYQKYWLPFGEILIKMETEGMLVDREYLAEIEKIAKAEQEDAVNRFRNWAIKYCPDAKYMNVGSDTQLRQLLFGGTLNCNNPDEILPHERLFKVPNIEKIIEEGKKAPTKFRNIKLHSIGVKLPAEKYTATGWPSVGGEALKTLAANISAQYNFVDESNDLLIDDNAENAAEREADEESEANKPPAEEKTFATEEEARDACRAIASLCEVCSIDSLISNFILPLQGCNVSGRNGRVHCSLNINTETGRLSARRPNLQNQPALEKDRYKIRQAFIAAPGNSLIVADYGQLELRILAHLANCKSMLDAFEAGGDFHSRTAMNMYPHIRNAIEMKQVLLEWHPQPGEDKPPVPLLKDAFGSERRKAKMLNFSIAYGKTPVGLARDWKVSVEEARETVSLWYSDRKEVLTWQEARKKEARMEGCVYTLLGRARRFPSFKSVSRSQRNHIERAAINTPVQGSAADVAMCAMIEISKNVKLKDLGWKLLLQVHDEVILEGPSESAEVAKAIVVECMSKPFNGENILRVDLNVDAKCAQNWYSAK